MTTTTKRVSAGVAGGATNRVPNGVLGFGPFLLLEGDSSGALAAEGDAGGFLKLEGDAGGSGTTGTTKRISETATQNTTNRVPIEVIGTGPFLLLTGDFEGALRLVGDFDGYLKLTGDY